MATTTAVRTDRYRSTDLRAGGMSPAELGAALNSLAETLRLLADRVSEGMDPAAVAEVVRAAPNLALVVDSRDTRPIVIDDIACRVWVDGDEVPFTYREYRLLQHLIDNPERAFSREQLYRAAWDASLAGRTRTVDVHVRRLRAKLGKHADRIATVRNVGYRFEPA
jgi:DNA-binding response OmpR family regulator